MSLKKYDFNKSIREMSLSDLKDRLLQDKIRLKKIKFGHTISPLENPSQIKMLRRGIARLHTQIHLKESLK